MFGNKEYSLRFEDSAIKRVRYALILHQHRLVTAHVFPIHVGEGFAWLKHPRSATARSRVASMQVRAWLFWWGYRALAPARKGGWSCYTPPWTCVFYVLCFGRWKDEERQKRVRHVGPTSTVSNWRKTVLGPILLCLSNQTRNMDDFIPPTKHQIGTFPFPSSKTKHILE